MKISLIGYMGCGKSHIAKSLGQKTNLEFFDTDSIIETKNNSSIAEIFNKKGEIGFRKEEKNVLDDLLTKENNIIISLGGGTPAYYDNMEAINKYSVSIFLRAKISTLVERLKLQKQNRPLISNISDEDLPEFIAKHLFERNVYYQKAKIIIDVDGKSLEEITLEILTKIKF